ncbi:MAG TPA: pectic acid lyase [Planctomycetaceae bacterium]|nr:pectic acid lyase [Planctomycetaceae bacterium]
MSLHKSLHHFLRRPVSRFFCKQPRASRLDSPIAVGQLLVVVSVALMQVACVCTDKAIAQTKPEALDAAKRATHFLTESVAENGGYLWNYSEDLELREGEGIVQTQTVWVQPPGTPEIGMAFVELFNASGDVQFLFAAYEAARALQAGQMRSGGWQAQIEFEPQLRRKWAYRTDPRSKRSKDQSSLDDDKTQSAIRFLIALDVACDGQAPVVAEMVQHGLDGLLNKAQLSCGGFPQVWTDQSIEPTDRPKRASFPVTWPREYPGHREYWYRPTLNDDLAPTVMATLLAANAAYDDPRLMNAARRLGDFLLAAQLPDPQPAWAQQYSFALQPIWARKFEPPAVTGGESQGAMTTLMDLFEATGEAKYLEPIPDALDYLGKSLLPNGKLARFYELKTNRPLYFDRQYNLTYNADDLPTHYSFEVPSRLKQLRERYNQLSNGSDKQSNSRTIARSKVREIIAELQPAGYWRTETPMRYHKHGGPTISMRQTSRNLRYLAAFLRDN